VKKCLFLIPTTYNDGGEIPAEVIDAVFDELFRVFGSYSQDGITEGTWKLKDGTKVKDRSLKVWIVMEDDKVDLLKELIKKFARILKQEEIYFEVMDWSGEFIGPE